MKVLIATQKPFTPETVEGIKAILLEKGHEVALLEKYVEDSELAPVLADADAVIVRSNKITAQLISQAPKLKIIVRAGAGYDNIDLEAASKAGIVVMNTPGQNANGVAELVIGLMIFMARHQFNPTSGSEIMGKTLGLQAYGNVGRLVGQKAMALGMKILAYDPFLSKEAIESTGAEAVESLEELYRRSDYISLHIPATPQTIKSINRSLISLLPQNATLVNSARDTIINEDDLLELLKERQDLKYVADVVPHNYEELCKVAGLRVFATPKKMGAQTAEANLNAGLAAARQICDYFETGCEKFRVNR